MLSQYFLQSLNFFANLFGGNYGLAIISLTIAIRLLLLPIIIPSAKSHRKMVGLKDQVDELKKKYANDNKLFQQKQLELYQQHNINPFIGCLPQVIQAILFIAFYRFLITTLNGSDISSDSLNFLWLNLHQPDKIYILPILAAATQFLLGLMLKPATSTVAEKKLAAQTKSTKDDKSAQEMGDMAQAMQNQMLFLMPVLIGFFAITLPSGLSLYWVTSSIFSIVQQYIISGPGGLTPYLSKIGITINKT